MLETFDKPFSEAYEFIRQKHNSIIEIDSDTLQAIEALSKKDKDKDETFKYISITLIIIIFFLTFPIIIGKGIDLTILFYPQVASFLSKKTFLYENFEFLVSAILGLFTIISYTILIPLLGKKIQFLRLKTTENVNQSGIKFILYIFVANYFAGFLLLLFLFSFEIFNEYILKILTCCWLMIPIIFFGFIPSILLLYFLVSYEVNKEIKENPSSPLPTILLELFRLLTRIDSINTFGSLNNHEREKIVNKIVLISYYVENLYVRPFGNPVSVWTKEQMQLAADNFLTLSSWIYFPQENTKENIQNRLKTYINIFLSGEYHLLPRDKIFVEKEIKESVQQINGIKKISSFVAIAIYLFLPILILILYTSLSKTDIHPLIQTALSVFYIIWIVLGLLSFADKFTPEIKELFFEIIKSIIGKK